MILSGKCEPQNHKVIHLSQDKTTKSKHRVLEIQTPSGVIDGHGRYAEYN